MKQNSTSESLSFSDETKILVRSSSRLAAPAASIAQSRSATTDLGTLTATGK